jgi:hypothetical protein
MASKDYRQGLSRSIERLSVIIQGVLSKSKSNNLPEAVLDLY